MRHKWDPPKPVTPKRGYLRLIRLQYRLRHSALSCCDSPQPAIFFEPTTPKKCTSSKLFCFGCGEVK